MKKHSVILKHQRPTKEPTPRLMANHSLSYSKRAAQALNPTGQQLLLLMDEKQTNLCVSGDYTKCQDLLSLADLIGPEIALFKTHVDILEDFTPAFITDLTVLAEKHHFLLFEDRKFADIGNTVKMQYRDGIYRISDWAHIVNAHILPGPGIIEGLKEVGLPKQRGLLLLAEMSAKGALTKGPYTATAVRWAEENSEFVMGFICRQKLSSHPGMVHCTPGVHISAKGDSLSQQYLSPSQVIGENYSDLIIVGRGILETEDPLLAARLYRDEGWKAYLQRL